MSKRILVSLAAIILGWTGCVSSSRDIYQRNDLTLSMATVRNAWLEELDRVNPDLHDSILIALVRSRQTGREVFIHKRTIGEGEAARAFYGTSMERAGAENLMGVNFATREFLFDHFNNDDGPSLETIRERLFAREAIRKVKRDLGIFGIK